MTSTLLLLALAGCKNDQKLNRRLDEYIGAEHFAVIQVDPPSIDYGALPADAYVEEVVTVTNVGTDMSTLTVRAVDLTIGDVDGFTIIDAPATTELRLNESLTFTVGFAPATLSDVSGQVVVSSDDEVNPHVPVALAGRGIWPQLLVEPDPLAYAPTLVGCPLSDTFALRNVGTQDLTITAIASEGTGFDILERPALPLILAPGASAPVAMTFAPTDGGSFTGTLSVESDDPRDIVRAAQEGSASDPGRYLDAFLVPSAGKLDILFAVDQSNSMAPDQALLAEQASALATALQTVTDDVQVGVVTGDNGCLVGGIMAPTNEDFHAKFTNAVQQGDETMSGYVYTEALIYLAWKAVIEQGGEFGCNTGFPRPDALLHVIPVTDEPYDGDGLVHTSWWSMLEDLRYHQDADHLVKFSAVAKPDYAGAYADVVTETHGTLLDIRTNWSAEVDTVAASNITVDTFPVTAPPDEPTMRVYLDRVLLSTGWMYRSDIRAVVIPEGVSSGHLVEIQYETPLDCTSIE